MASSGGWVKAEELYVLVWDYYIDIFALRVAIGWSISKLVM